jgi:endonuclease/exonuclease/phosphatase family metal-dependent hydrolase
MAPKIKVMAYNVQNLFDTKLDSPAWSDGEFTPDGKQAWTSSVLRDKVSNLAIVIKSENPDVIAFEEIETEVALMALYNTGGLASLGFKTYAIAANPDHRGIRTAIFSKFPIKSMVSHRVWKDEWRQQNPLKYLTRDVMEVTLDMSSLGGKGIGDLVILTNHWPSKIGGPVSVGHRVDVAVQEQQFTEEILGRDGGATIISMGDFNDDITDQSMAQALRQTMSPSQMKAGEYYSTDRELLGQDTILRGTIRYSGDWDSLDHILYTQGEDVLARKVRGFHYVPKSYKAVRNMFVTPKSEAPKGCEMPRKPTNRCVDGASDHFPVSAQFELR